VLSAQHHGHWHSRCEHELSEPGTTVQCRAGDRCDHDLLQAGISSDSAFLISEHLGPEASAGSRGTERAHSSLGVSWRTGREPPRQRVPAERRQAVNTRPDDNSPTGRQTCVPECMPDRERKRAPAGPSRAFSSLHALLWIQNCRWDDVVSTYSAVIPTSDDINTCRMMNDDDGPDVARWFYESLFATKDLDLDHIAYALDRAVFKLREKGVLASRWAAFIHIGG
jgi:hypothetical protein